LHGGATPKNQNVGASNGRATHGLYSASLSPAEQEVWDDISLDSLDAEIRMCRIWLARASSMAYEVSKDANSAANLTGFELVEVTKTNKSGGGGKGDTAITSKRPDLWTRIDRLTGRLAQLVKTRAELIAAKQTADGKDDTPLPWID
jgi:hypothetical protein